MEIRFRKDFEDVIVDADEVVHHFQCPLLPSLSQYTAQIDLRRRFAVCVRNALTRFFWDLRDHYESIPGRKIQPPPVETLREYLEEEVSGIAFGELLRNSDLAMRIYDFPLTKLKYLHEFLISKCKAGIEPVLIGFGPVEATLGGKFVVRFDVDLLMRRGKQYELLVVPDPFVDPWVYLALVPAYRQGLRARDIEAKVYIGSFQRYPIVIHRETDVSPAALRDLLDSFYQAEVAEIFPIGQHLDPGRSNACRTCVYREECRSRDRGEVVELVKELRR